MRFKRDIIRYTTKPDSYEMARIQNRLKNMNQVEFSVENLARTINNGSSFYLCQFKENGSVSIDNTLGTEYIALDIDNKDHTITLQEVINMIQSEFKTLPILSYNTFSSSSERPKFRIIYKLDRFVSPEEFRKIYNVLILTLNKDHEIIDCQASNCNRLWASTNKGVMLYDDAIPFNTDKIISRLPEIPKKKKATKIDTDKSTFKYSNRYYIKNKEMIMNQLKEEIDLKDYLETHFGAKIKNNRCACVIHGGNNKSALAVYNDTCHCFTRCGTMNIISLAREYYHINDFDEVAFRLIEEYNIMIDKNSFIRK